MVINQAKKVIFIGIPFSASSAISKELIDNYGFEPLFHKHSNIPLLIANRPDIRLDEYIVAAVKRDPVDVVFTSYNKIKNNAHGVFTDTKYFVENGGHVTRRARKIYKDLQLQKWSFNDYVKHVYRIFPYDSYLSYNKPYINFTIDGRFLDNDFQRLLTKANIASKGPLPVYNKTDKIIENPNLSCVTMKSAFGSFVIFNEIPGYSFTTREVGYWNYIRFLFCQRARNLYWLIRDKKRCKTRAFTVD